MDSAKSLKSDRMLRIYLELARGGSSQEERAGREVPCEGTECPEGFKRTTLFPG